MPTRATTKRQPRTKNNNNNSKPPDPQITELQGKVEALQKGVQSMGQMIDLSQQARAWLKLAEAGSTAYRSTTFSGTGLFGPGDPLLARDAESEPRLFQYNTNENLIAIPRASGALLPFSTLRSLSIMCQEIRLNIQKTKETIRGLDWDIVFEGEKVTVAGIKYQATPDIDRVKHFWEKPDGIHDFDAWLMMVLEEVLVTDALTLYPNQSTEGFTLDVVDGTTIKPLIDFHGRTPRPPAPAYTQTLFGVPRSHYTSNRLLYLPRNPKVNSLYGESPIEWVVQMIVQALRYNASRTSYFTEGNIPGAFGGLPAEWTVQQIQDFTDWFNAILVGDESRAYKIMFLPHSGSSLPVVNFQQTNFENPAYNEWLMTVACWAFGNSPSEFGLTRGDGLGGAGYMDAGENAQYRGSIGSVTQFLKRVIDRVNRDCLSAPWAKFKWVGLEPPEDEEKQASIHMQYVGKIYNEKYVQDELGIPQEYRITAPPPQPGMPGMSPMAGPNGMPLLPAPQQQQQPWQYQEEAASSGWEDEQFTRAVNAELKKWEGKTLRALKNGWQYENWTSDVIPEVLLKSMNNALSQLTDPKEVDKLFKQVAEEPLQKRRRSAPYPLTTPMPANPYDPLILPLQQEFEDAIAAHLADLQTRILRAASDPNNLINYGE